MVYIPPMGNQTKRSIKEKYLLKRHFYFNCFASVCVQHVDGTTQSGVVGADKPPHIHRVFNVGDLHTN